MKYGFLAIHVAISFSKNDVKKTLNSLKKRESLKNCMPYFKNVNREETHVVFKRFGTTYVKCLVRLVKINGHNDGYDRV